MTDLYGFDLLGESAAPKPKGPVLERFLFAPFSVLDARSSEWQERKRAWKAIGIQSELGRLDNAFGFSKQLLERAGGYLNEDGSKKPTADTSLFDPVLCELCYRWFCPAGGWVLDPFAGGSVRGIVASKMGRPYLGIDVREEQVEANREQAERICDEPVPVYEVGDSRLLLGQPSSLEFDFVFSCPPYGDLEQYSDSPDDLSNMEWDDFCLAYAQIIEGSVRALKDDRFACFVVGDFRDSRGMYRDFVSRTIAGFRDAGAQLYNDGILVTVVGSASLRVAKQFDSSRKFCKTHQNVLVFCKGDPKKATASIREAK